MWFEGKVREGLKLKLVVSVVGDVKSHTSEHGTIPHSRSVAKLNSADQCSIGCNERALPNVGCFEIEGLESSMARHWRKG